MSRLESSDASIRPIAPTHKPLKTWGLGRRGIVLNAHVHSDRIIVEVKITTDEADDHFEQLLAHQDEIGAQVGGTLTWNEKPGAQSSNIRVVREGFTLSDSEAWPDHQRWMIKYLDVFYRVFYPYVQRLT